MLCCGILALAASLTVAVGRRVAMALMVGGGVLLDSAALWGHAQTLVCGA